MRARRILFTCAVMIAALLVSVSASVAAPQEHRPDRPAAAAADQHGQPGEGVKEGAVEEGHTAEGEHEEGLLPTVARITNFAILVGILVYFLRAPLAGYLASRTQQIRSDLVTAADLRRSAEAQLADIERRMAAVPAELDALRRQGAADVAAEEARIRAAAEADRQRLLEHMRRDVDMQVRIARRALMAEAATLATGIARQRIDKTMTPDDQLRLIDRYTSQVGAAS